MFAFVCASELSEHKFSCVFTTIYTKSCSAVIFIYGSLIKKLVYWLLPANYCSSLNTSYEREYWN